MKKKLTLFLACAALAGTLGGCSRESGTQTVPATTPETKEESRPETTPAPSQAEPSGTYTATAQGFGGDVTVTLTIKDDHLTAVDIQGEKETPGVGSKAIEELSEKILASNTVAVDGISGATFTSTAILTAAAEALGQSGVTLAAVEPPQEDVVYQDTTAEIVVVGGGIAGMSAAMELADAGKEVILLEKTNLLGGAATVSHSAVWAIDSPFTSEVTQFTADDIYEFFNKQAGPVNNKEVFYALANESTDSLQFLVENGVVFDDIAQCNPQADPRFWYSTSENFGVGMMEKLNEAYMTRKIDTRLNTSAAELICDENNAVVGVTAQCGEQQYTISAQQIILATGGYGQNPEMMEKYVNGYEFIVSNSTVAGATGDGHNMGVAAGGYIIGAGSMGAGSSLGKMDPVTFGDALLVNVEGEKAGPANEHYTKLYEVNISQPDGQTYSIYPADISGYSKGGTLEVMEEYYQSGDLHKADTLEELAEQMGIQTEALMNTVEIHNNHCAKGESDEFNTPPEAMVPIINGPFYGMVHRAGTIGTIAGLAVDEEMRVIREDQTVIENLYAAGELIYGNWFNGNYPMSGTGLGGCVSSGRIAAHTILADH